MEIGQSPASLSTPLITPPPSEQIAETSVPDSLQGTHLPSNPPPVVRDRNWGPCCHIEAYPETRAEAEDAYSRCGAQNVSGVLLTVGGAGLAALVSPLGGALAICFGGGCIARGQGVRLGRVPSSLPTTAPLNEQMV